MTNKMMLQLFEAREDAYRSHHPSTAEMDIAVFRAHCAGKSAMQIGMDVPCSKSTVYRALRRVTSFLQLPEQLPLWDAIRQYAMEHEPNYGNWNAQSLLEMLYVVYTDHNRIDIGCAKTGFVDLHGLLRDLPEREVDAAFDTVCDLCLCHERAGFTEGIKVGIRLGEELRMGMEV